MFQRNRCTNEKPDDRTSEAVRLLSQKKLSMVINVLPYLPQVSGKENKKMRGQATIHLRAGKLPTRNVVSGGETTAVER
jgi:hypothetical protein